MATNIAKRSSTSTSITIGAWYQGSPNAYSAEFFRVSGSKFGTDYAHPIGSGNWTTSDFTCTGLQPNTTYQFYVNFLGFSGNKLADTGIVSYTTDSGGGGDPDPPGDTTDPIINITNIYASKVGTEIRIYVDWTSSDNVDLLMHRGEITNSYGELTWDGYDMSKYQKSHYFNKDGSNNVLVNGKSYTVAITAYDTSGNLKTATRSITISVSVKPGPWTGFTSITSGGSYASSDGLYQYPIHAVEWNNFTAHINLFRDYKGLPLTTFTSAISKNTNFTAAIINQGVNAINQIGYAIPTVTSGSTITANTFLLMKSRLNAIV